MTPTMFSVLASSLTFVFTINPFVMMSETLHQLYHCYRQFLSTTPLNLLKLIAAIKSMPSIEKPYVFVYLLYHQGESFPMKFSMMGACLLSTYSLMYLQRQDYRELKNFKIFGCSTLAKVS
jgi:hypothetical protein